MTLAPALLVLFLSAVTGCLGGADAGHGWRIMTAIDAGPHGVEDVTRGGRGEFAIDTNATLEMPRGHLHGWYEAPLTGPAMRTLSWTATVSVAIEAEVRTPSGTEWTTTAIRCGAEPTAAEGPGVSLRATPRADGCDIVIEHEGHLDAPRNGIAIAWMVELLPPETRADVRFEAR